MSFLDIVNAEAELVRDAAVKDVPVPPSGRFVVRCKPPGDRDKLTDVVARYRVGGALTKAQELQLLVDCCDEILERDADTGELVRVEGDDGPLRFDAGDARWAGTCQTARDCVEKLFHLADGAPLALAGIADALIDWLQGVDAELAARVQETGKKNAASSSTPRASN
jgi:hypothetical protein